MLRKDLLMRQFEEFGKVMAILLGFKKQNDWEKFEKEISDAAKKFTPFEIEVVEFFCPEDFEKEILNYPGMLPGQYKILADLLFEKMKYYMEQGRDEKVPELRKKCILLYKKFAGNFTYNEFNLDVHYKLEFLEKM